MELGLLLESHGARHRERKIHVLDERGREPESQRHPRLLAHLFEIGLRLGVGVVRLAAQVAVDAELARKLEDAGDPRLVRLTVRPGELRPEAADELRCS